MKAKQKWIKLVCPRCGNVDEQQSRLLVKDPNPICSADCGAKMIRLPADVEVKATAIGRVSFTDKRSGARFSEVGFLTEQRQREADAAERAEKAAGR